MIIRRKEHDARSCERTDTHGQKSQGYGSEVGSFWRRCGLTTARALSAVPHLFATENSLGTCCREEHGGSARKTKRYHGQEAQDRRHSPPSIAAVSFHYGWNFIWTY
jgi:hypothetical protein